MMDRPPDILSGVDHVARARAERSELADLLDTLTAEQWETPTLCEGWRVRDVVAHAVSYDEIGLAGLVRRLAAGWLDPDRANAIGVAEYVGKEPAELVAILRAHLTPSGLPAAFGGAIGLTDALIHHQDIRRPLGLPREVPADRLRAALPLALFGPPIRGVLRVRDVRIAATDLDWSFGRGPLVEGPAEALLLAVAGRRGVIGELSGPGVERLAGRIPA